MARSARHIDVGDFVDPLEGTSFLNDDRGDTAARAGDHADRRELLLAFLAWMNRKGAQVWMPDSHPRPWLTLYDWSALRAHVDQFLRERSRESSAR